MNENVEFILYFLLLNSIGTIVILGLDYLEHFLRYLMDVDSPKFPFRERLFISVGLLTPLSLIATILTKVGGS